MVLGGGDLEAVWCGGRGIDGVACYDELEESELERN